MIDIHAWITYNAYMNTDREQFFEDLAKDYPELMKRSKVNFFEVESGWHSIIRVMCDIIYNDLAQAEYRLKAATEHQRNDNGVFLNECTVDHQRLLAALPVFTRIREYFGHMRVEIEGGCDDHRDVVLFAKGMSACTCEICGKPGKLDDDLEWVKTACIDHRLSTNSSFREDNASERSKFFND